MAFRSRAADNAGIRAPEMTGIDRVPCLPQMIESSAESSNPSEPRLTSLAHGGGCGCKIAPGVLRDILRSPAQLPIPEALLVGLETSDDAAVYQLNNHQALVATTDFFMPVVDDPYDFGAIAATNAISDIYAMGGQPIMALALLGMPIKVLSAATIGRVLEGGRAICARAGIPIAGGHSIDSVEPIYGLVVLGLVHPDHLQRNSSARAGDILVLGKPLGVGVLSAALKREQLDTAGYARLLATTTQLNTPGPELARLAGVHAMTDVTGFGLAGHALEMARGAGLTLALDWSRVPLIPGVVELANAGYVTGASGRNWESCAAEITLPVGSTGLDQALLCDPQTSGGLLVACAPAAVQQVLAVFGRHGFAQAAQIGEVLPATADAPRLLVRGSLCSTPE
jgi:selenide,water dikinase